MSDTPETDGVADFFVSGAFSTNPDNKTVPLEFSRKLERERDEAREKYCEVLTDNMLHIATITRLERERDNLSSECDQMKRARDTA